MERLIVRKEKVVDVQAIKHLLPPGFFERIGMPEQVLTYEIQNPEELILHPDRFDLISKLTYVKYRDQGYPTDWHVHIYKEYISAFSLGKFKEYDGSKASFSDYLENFNNLIQSIRENGFDSRISIVPINENGAIIHGAHRTSICAYFNIPITVARVNFPVKYNYNFFLKRKLGVQETDAVAFEYCIKEKDARIAILNSISADRKEVVEKY